MVRVKHRLPKVIVPFKNADKTFHEKWGSGSRDPLNIPHPFRCTIVGPPNRGKTNIIKNILVRAKPVFERILVVHCDPEGTSEYSDIDATLLSEIPAPTEFEGDVKTACILDDISWKNLSKEQKSHLDRLCGYVSTHKNVSVFCTTQEAFTIPTIVRRCSNLLIIFKQHDLDSLVALSRKTGLKRDDFMTLFKMLVNEHDSLWLDLTAKSPYPLRINGYQMIQQQEN